MQASPSEDASSDVTASNLKPAPPESAPPAAAKDELETKTDRSQEDAVVTPGELEKSRRRQNALDQADAVLEAVGGDCYLNGFNLLGVIANPRGTIASLTPSYHGRYNTAAPTEATTTMDYSLEGTLTTVTEQMEAFNHMLEDWSRQILEDDAYDNNTNQDIPDAQLRELPAALQSLPLVSLQQHLEATGKLAHAFSEILQQQQQQQDLLLDASSATDTTTTTSITPDSVLLSDIPPIFFQADFDLTNPQTFAELLMMTASEDTKEASLLLPDTTSATITANKDDNNDGDYDRPISEWFPLLPPDAFGPALDSIELSLLRAVRSKSADFFSESVRFAQLQAWIWSSLQQVQSCLQSIQQIQGDDWLRPMLHTVPAADQQRRDLRRLASVLERTDDVLQCKSSLVGVLSAQDDLLALEQIQLGRKLLAGGVGDNGNEIVELGRLQSLSGVADQLNQYEQLVVTKLRDELVEIFLDWNAATSAYSSGSQHKHARVREIMGALKSCHGLRQTQEAYSHRLQDMIRMTVRTTVGEFAADGSMAAPPSLSSGTTAMTLSRFLDCLDMLFEQLLGLLTAASGVDAFCAAEGYSFQNDDVTAVEDDSQQVNHNHEGNINNKDASQKVMSSDEDEATTPLSVVVAGAAELSSKSVSELLRLRKDAHSLVTLDEMKSIWDACLQFTTTIETLSGRSSTLRSTLLAQAKAFVERKHESNMSALVAALDSEKWSQCEVSAERQDALTRLCSGRSLIASPSPSHRTSGGEVAMSPEAEVEGTRYKVVWSCLLLIEMVTTNIKSAAHFSTLSSGIVGKVAELLRLFNSRTTHLVLGAGAIHSNAKLKSINAKHLSLVTQCLGLIISILPPVRAALMAQMPEKQHTLLSSLDQIRREFADHNEKVLNKFVTIIGGIVEHGLAPKIAGTDFDTRTTATSSCVFLEGVATNTKKMHQVLKLQLPVDHLRDVFSRIFAFVDTKIPQLFIKASENEDIRFVFPTSDAGKRRLLSEVETMIGVLNGLDGVLPWDFTAVTVLERRLEIRLSDGNMDESNVLPDDTTLPPMVVANGEGKEEELSSTEKPVANPEDERTETEVTQNTVGSHKEKLCDQTDGKSDKVVQSATEVDGGEHVEPESTWETNAGKAANGATNNGDEENRGSE